MSIRRILDRLQEGVYKDRVLYETCQFTSSGTGTWSKTNTNPTDLADIPAKLFLMPLRQIGQEDVFVWLACTDASDNEFIIESKLSQFAPRFTSIPGITIGEKGGIYTKTIETAYSYIGKNMYAKLDFNAGINVEPDDEWSLDYSFSLIETLFQEENVLLLQHSEANNIGGGYHTNEVFDGEYTGTFDSESSSSFWIYLGQTTSEIFIGQGKNDYLKEDFATGGRFDGESESLGAWWCLKFAENGNIYFNDPSNSTSRGTYTAGTWYHVLIWNNRTGSHKLYINGNLIVTTGNYQAQDADKTRNVFFFRSNVDHGTVTNVGATAYLERVKLFCNVDDRISNDNDIFAVNAIPRTQFAGESEISDDDYSIVNLIAPFGFELGEIAILINKIFKGSMEVFAHLYLLHLAGTNLDVSPLHDKWQSSYDFYYYHRIYPYTKFILPNIGSLQALFAFVGNTIDDPTKINIIDISPGEFYLTVPTGERTETEWGKFYYTTQFWRFIDNWFSYVDRLKPCGTLCNVGYSNNSEQLGFAQFYWTAIPFNDSSGDTLEIKYAGYRLFYDILTENRKYFRSGFIPGYMAFGESNTAGSISDTTLIDILVNPGFESVTITKMAEGWIRFTATGVTLPTTSDYIREIGIYMADHEPHMDPNTYYESLEESMLFRWILETPIALDGSTIDISVNLLTQYPADNPDAPAKIIARWNDNEDLDFADVGTTTIFAKNPSTLVFSTDTPWSPDVGKSLDFSVGVTAGHAHYNKDSWTPEDEETFTIWIKKPSAVIWDGGGTEHQYLCGTITDQLANEAQVLIEPGATTNLFRVTIRNSAGASVFTSASWQPFDWHTYYNDTAWHFVEVNWSLTNKVAHVFVDGVLRGRTDSATGIFKTSPGTRSGLIATVKWGVGWPAVRVLKCYLDYMCVHAGILHTGTTLGVSYYTPPDSETYYQDLLYYTKTQKGMFTFAAYRLILQTLVNDLSDYTDSRAIKYIGVGSSDDPARYYHKTLRESNPAKLFEYLLNLSNYDYNDAITEFIATIPTTGNLIEINEVGLFLTDTIPVNDAAATWQTAMLYRYTLTGLNEAITKVEKRIALIRLLIDLKES